MAPIKKINKIIIAQERETKTHLPSHRHTFSEKVNLISNFLSVKFTYYLAIDLMD
jgi:hypothetical protein